MFQIQVQYREKVRQFYVKEILTEYSQIIENNVTNINSNVPMIEITRKSVDSIHISSAHADFSFFDGDCRKKLILRSLSLSEKPMKSENKFVGNQWMKVLLFFFINGVYETAVFFWFCISALSNIPLQSKLSSILKVNN